MSSRGNTVPKTVLTEIYGRHDSKPFRVSVGAGATVKIIESNVGRHTLRIRNVSTTQDVNYGRSSADATSADRAQTLMARQTDIFEMHTLGFVPGPNGALLVAYHSEWDDEVWINNPGAGAVTIEVYEVN